MVEAREEEIELKYEGPEYAGEMSARQLATVLESLEDYVDALVGSGFAENLEKPEVKVQALQEGSFEIHAILEYLAPSGTAATLAGFFGLAWKFYWKNMRRVVESFSQDAERGVIVAKLLSGETIEMSEPEWRLYNSKRARKALRGIVSPLNAGATRLQLAAGDTQEVIDAPDAGRFDEPPVEEGRLRRFDVWASPETIRFDPDKPWGLTTEDGSLTATIEDKAFRDGVAAGRIRVGRFDVFHLAIREETTQKNGEPRTRRIIERVIEHRQGAQQDELPADGWDA